jgi:hypothetical protein
VENISTVCSCRQLYKYKVKIVHIHVGCIYIYIGLGVCRGLLGRQTNFGMTWLEWDWGEGVVNVCNAPTRCLMRVLWDYSSVGRRSGFIIWPLEGRPVGFGLFWVDVLGGRLVESVDYLLSWQLWLQTLLVLRVVVYYVKPGVVVDGCVRRLELVGPWRNWGGGCLCVHLQLYSIFFEGLRWPGMSRNMYPLYLYVIDILINGCVRLLHIIP